MSREYVLKSFASSTPLRIDYAGELNPQQHAAVTAAPGPSLVIAGAGSGKTRTLTYRVAFLLEHGVAPDRILLLTFTNKAAREMMRRVTDLLGTELQALWGGTFHSIGARILRRHADQLGFRRDFTILDREDATGLLKACLADSNIDVKATRFPKPDVVADVLSKAVNTCRSVRETVAQDYSYFDALAPRIEELGAKYAARKRAANVMDFDDLIALWLELLRTRPEAAEVYQRRFQYILVDEYQDTNRLQSDLIDLLAAKHHNVMVVGDDSQSIYSWRGANFRNILGFPERYPNAQTYKIETNYRSTPEILNLANAAIAPNVHQFAKTLAPARKSGAKPALVVCPDAAQQAAFVAQRALELREEGVSLNEMAVLYRSHFHALELQLELTRRNIPVLVTSGIRFFEQAHIKDVAAYLKLIVNPTDELAFKRLAQMLPGIGGKGADKIWKEYSAAWPAVVAEAWNPEAEEDATPQSAAGGADGGSALAAALQRCASAVPKKSALAWAEFVITISQLEAPEVQKSPATMIKLILEAGYKDYLQENFANYEQRLEELEQMASFAQQFSGIDEFLTQMSLLANVEADDAQGGGRARDDERLRLSTIHQAKGLEFGVVFLIMLCDGLFPSSRSVESADGEEEERRLFYVAVTRARNELYLSYPLVRVNPAYGGVALQQPSRFVQPLSRDLIEEWELKGAHAYY